MSWSVSRGLGNDQRCSWAISGDCKGTGGDSTSPGVGEPLEDDPEEGLPNWKSGVGRGPGMGEASGRDVIAYRRLSENLREGAGGG